MERYPSYKPSGVKWLGEIPSHWRLVKSKYLWKESFATSENGNEELLSVSQYDGITPAKGDSRSESLKGYKIVSENDLVINIMLAWMGGLGVSNYNGIVSPAYCIYKLNDDSNPKFLHYLYKTPLYLAEFARHSTGVIPSRWRMYTDDFGQVLSLIPPREEQNAIVSYLDERTAKIDAAIAQQQKMIDLLNERKQIIINRAVTKGLNPNAKMKDSGVEWIGEIPEGWEIRRLKRLVGVSDGTHDTPLYVEPSSNTYPLITSRCIVNGEIIMELANHISYADYFEISKRSFVQKYDVIMPMIGTVGNPAIVMTNGEFAIKNVALFRTYGSYNLAKLLVYLLNSRIVKDQLSFLFKGGVQNFVSQEILKNLILVIPDNIESILSHIDSRILKIDKVIDNCKRQISLLQERKQIIINEVVTGKVKVV